MTSRELEDLLGLLDHSVAIVNGKIEVKDLAKLRSNIYRLAEVSALGTGVQQGLARYLTRFIALSLGTVPASIHDLYIARGKGKVDMNFTVPAINLRAMTFDSAKAVFRAAIKLDAGAFIFEIARSEMGYTDQRPSEYTASVLAAAIAEGYKGPVFIQGDHFQVSAKKYAADPKTEINALKDLMKESVAAGFFNIDVDTSTLVDLSKTTIPEQQHNNTSISAMFAAFIRSIEPQGIRISIGGEIGEVGGHNSTEEELRAYMDGFNTELKKLDTNAFGISKISIQTGTSHGGVVLPDGSIAKVSVDFGTLQKLSRIARQDYAMGGAVQHGASTLPEEAFGKFTEAEACEVHLATNFQNMLFDRLPVDLRDEIYRFLDEKSAADRKPDMTDEQFYYKVRKNAIGPFKKKLWNMPAAKKSEIDKAWEDQFVKLFKYLAVGNTSKIVAQTVKTVMVEPKLNDYVSGFSTESDISDLAD
jgi:fructose/tagatose bisphosphate aldolase